jgi:hypothetical protein
MTITEFKAMQKPKKAKYRNKKIKRDGILFDSTKEADRYSTLKLLNGGMITDLQCQVVFKLIVNEQMIATYIADFVYKDTSTKTVIVEDVKSEITRKLPVYRIKKKLLKIF